MLLDSVLTNNSSSPLKTFSSIRPEVVVQYVQTSSRPHCRQKQPIRRHIPLERTRYHVPIKVQKLVFGLHVKYRGR